MSLSQPDKDDVLTNVSIELERMFGILSNHYSRPESEGLLPFLAEIEAHIKASLNDYNPE